MLQYFITIGAPTPVSVSPVQAHAFINPVRTGIVTSVSAVEATASIEVPASAGNINQVTVNPVVAQAFVDAAGPLINTTRTNPVVAHARMPQVHLFEATHVSLVAAHAKMLVPAYVGPVFIGAKLGFLTLQLTRSATNFTVATTRQGSLTVE